MSATGRAAGQSAGQSDRDPWARYGWVVWAAWLVFLIFPVLESLAADTVVRRVVGLVGTAVFGLVYIGGLLRAGFGQDRHAGVLRAGALAVLTLIAAVVGVAIGLGAISFLPFLMAFGMFALPRPAELVVRGRGRRDHGRALGARPGRGLDLRHLRRGGGRRSAPARGA